MSGEEVRFGRFRFDLGRRELWCDGAPVRLGSRALDVLSALAAAKGNVVTKDELLARVWPGLVVEENNLQVQVSALRKALDEDKSGQSYLVTVPGRGYRLIGLIGNSNEPALPDKPSIAVLPFQNMSDDPKQEYFADGMVEDIITALCHMRWLFVIARDSSFVYKGRTVDVKQVGRELGVRYVVEGGVRKAAHRVRITAQLIDASTGAHLWADHFDGDREDIFDLQDRPTAWRHSATSFARSTAGRSIARKRPSKPPGWRGGRRPWTRMTRSRFLSVDFRSVMSWAISMGLSRLSTGRSFSIRIWQWGGTPAERCGRFAAESRTSP
jgi:TolB-like protein